MGRFVIHGKKPLSGEISVGGSKNAALPIIFSLIITRGVTTVYNLPDISDVRIALDILRSFGAVVVEGEGSATVDTRELEYRTPSPDSVSKIRASSYLIGACLARFGRAELSRFGGCNFDNRPIDMHLMAATALGATVDGSLIFAKELRGADIYFDKISVGATVNAILMTATAKGKSRIYGYAKEPHVVALIDFLRRAGAKAELSEECISVEGAELSSSSVTVIPDMIEAGTYLSLSLITDSCLRVVGADITHLEAYLRMALCAGAVIEYDSDSITLSGCLTEKMDVVAAPYPAFPTDLQPLLAPLLAACRGGSITDTVWRGRFGYLEELSKFGVRYERSDGCAAIIKSEFVPANAVAPDLRGGAALLLAALAAEGESVISGSEIIKRGYGDIERKLRRVGADIYEIE